MSRIAFVVEPPSRKVTPAHKGNNYQNLFTPEYIQLITASLLKRGHDVDIYNNTTKEITLGNLRYRPIDDNPKNNQADLIVVHNGSQELPLFNFKRAAVWQHNRTSLLKIWKRKELITLLRFRPDVICLSEDALHKTPKWIPYRNRALIPHAIHKNYLNAANTTTNRSNKAYFASRPSRNLDFLIQAWEQYVYPNMPEAELYICCPKTNKDFPFNTEQLKKSNIHYLGNLNQDELIELGKDSKLLCYPGHINETGCRVALDAIGLCLPIVTCGIGSLKDLVIDKKTGFIETNKEEYAKRIIECMTDIPLWNKLSKATKKHPWRQSYDQNVIIWENAFELK